MTLEETLTKFGLEPKEAKVYLACLELGPASVLQIAKKAVIKRPTAYLVIDALADKGYLSKSYVGKKIVFSAQKPETLLASFRRKEELLQEVLPELSAIMATTKSRPKISIFEGKDAVVQVFYEAIGSPEVWWFGSVRDVSRLIPEAPKQMTRVSKEKQPIVRDLLTHSPEDFAYAKKVTAENPNYEVRFLPKPFESFIDCAIYDNRIVIFGVIKDLFAVVIENKEVADSFRSLYSLAWLGATPFEKK